MSKVVSKVLMGYSLLVVMCCSVVRMYTVKKVKLFFAPAVEVEFTDRERGLGLVEDLARRGTRFPVIIYGPEGCGKTALLRQAVEVLDEYDYRTIFVSPLENELDRALQVSPSVRDVMLEVLKGVREPLTNLLQVALKVKAIIEERFVRPRIALLLDDLFQGVGLENAERYVKMLLNIIEYPLRHYESIIVLVSSSEGLTRERIGRHEWCKMYFLWNMGREGFKQLYTQLPGEKPALEEVWRLTGGNPRILAKLYEVGWNPETVIYDIIESKRLYKHILQLGRRELSILEEALEDPDVLLIGNANAEKVLGKLIKLNLVAEIPARREHLWIDEPPPQKDYELGIGHYIAWQTPLHREATKRALKEVLRRDRT